MAEVTTSSTTEMSKVELFNLRRNLKATFEIYKDVDESCKEKLLGYLLDGSNPSCLLEIKAALAGVARPFFIFEQGSLRTADARHSTIFLNFYHQPAVPSGYYHRLAEWLMLHSQISQAAINGDHRLPDWFNTLAFVYHSFRGYYYYPDAKLRIGLMASDLTPPELAGLVAVLVEGSSGDHSAVGTSLVQAHDIVAFFEQRSEDLSSALKVASSNAAEGTLRLLSSHRAICAAIVSAIVDRLTGGKRLKAAAIPILSTNLEAAKAPLLEKLKAGSVSERSTAADVLASLYGQEIVGDLQEALKSEKGARQRQTLEEFIRQLAGASPRGTTKSLVASELKAVELPAITMPDDPIPLPEGFRQSLEKMFEKANAKFGEQYEKQLAVYNSTNRPTWMSKPARTELFTPELQERLCQFMEGSGKKFTMNHRLHPAIHSNSIETWCDAGQLHLMHIIRLMEATGLASLHNTNFHILPQMIQVHRLLQAQPYGLREIDAAVTRVFGKPGLVGQTFLGYGRSSFELEDDAIWPYFYEHVDKLRDAVLGVATSPHDYYVNERRRNAIAIVGILPSVPPTIENAIWSIALGEAKTDRPLARRALSKAAGRLERGLQAIQDGKQSIRVAGAELLAELGDAAAVESLKKALKVEKQEAVKGIFLQAIELLGGDVEEFLGRRKQLLDAKKALEKKMPKGMEWFPLDALPTVRWAEDDKPVAQEIVRWWVIQSVQFKLPTCGALLRRAMGMCRPDDAAALAKFVLSSWIGYDTQVPNPSDTLAAATERAKKEFQTAKWIQDYFKTVEAYRDNILQQMQGQFLNSATGEKGALAVVSAGGDKHCVRIIEKYIRTYHGHRLAQSKALLEVLGWIDDPLAIQVLLSIGNRFRTAAIRKRAAEMVQELADRKGWTMEQLADRTIPDAGFVQAKDEEGRPIGKRAELVLDYGSRKFIVILNDDLEPVISRDDGKEVKALPAAAKDDDPELVKAAKAEFTAAKKTVKDVVKLLAEQLYEAVCSQRTWVASEWKSFLATHPIASALCRRVIWRAQLVDQSLGSTAQAAVDAPHPQATQTTSIFFRPLEDGTFTDVDDNSIELADTDIITVAHSSLMSSEEEQAWIDHLKDYEVPRLFVQFGRHTYRLTDSEMNKMDIDAFQGHMLTTFILRNKATKLGWQRGTAQDGGSFCDYFKPFRASGVTAMLEFTGSYVPEEDIPAGIRSLYFVPIKGNQEEADTWNAPKLRLGKVPAILISECYNDVRDIAAEGSGFDPEWEKKGLW